MALLSAHRGGPEGTRAPNTLETIAAACELGVDLVEFDVRVNSDGAFVIGHDGPSEVLLSSVLELIRGRARGHVDLKEDHAEIEIADLCLDRLGPDGFVVTTRFDAGISRLRAARPDVVVGLSLGRASPWLHRNELFPWRRTRAVRRESGRGPSSAGATRRAGRGRPSRPAGTGLDAELRAADPPGPAR